MEARIVWLIWSTLGAILIAATSKQAADEFKAWMPWIVERFIDRAVRRLPADEQERYAEEWRGHVREIPGDIGKLLEAVGCLRAANKMVGRLTLKDRSLDVSIALVTLVIIAPVMALLSIAIRLDSPGPVFVATQRIGLNNTPIWVVRFRTFYVDENGECQYSRLGRVMRRMSLDEIPQLFNVLKGDMTFIGPSLGRAPEFNTTPGLIPSLRHLIQAFFSLFRKD